MFKAGIGCWLEDVLAFRAFLFLFASHKTIGVIVQRRGYYIYQRWHHLLHFRFLSMSIVNCSTSLSSSSSSAQSKPLYDTRILRVSRYATPQQLEEALAPAAELLRQGEVVAFPTETVYGLGGNALDNAAISRIFHAKGRPSDNPLIVHIHDRAQLQGLVENVPEMANRLAEKFWPGPLTLVLPSSSTPTSACLLARASLPTVAVRLPAHPVAAALLRKSGLPLAAPSANLSGRPSPTTAQHVWDDLHGRIPMIVAIEGEGEDGEDGNEQKVGDVGVESTVVECSDSPPSITILRPGIITRTDLQSLCSTIYIDQAVEELQKQEEVDAGSVVPLKCTTERRALDPHTQPLPTPSPSPTPSLDATAPKAPGMKYQHYAPRAPVILVDGSIGFMLAQATVHLQSGAHVGLLISTEHRGRIQQWLALCADRAQVHVQVVGSHRDLNEVARNLYACLRHFDETLVQLIFSELFSSDGVGEAVMNRLNKAAGGKCIREQKTGGEKTNGK